jgi:calcineurin-like phosphoesterase family protein
MLIKTDLVILEENEKSYKCKLNESTVYFPKTTIKVNDGIVYAVDHFYNDKVNDLISKGWILTNSNGLKVNHYVISDTHFGHSGILKHREEFKSISEHDDTICNNILNTVEQNDFLWILGDIAFNKKSFNQTIVPLANHYKNINILLGNHDTDGSILVKDYIDIGIKVHGMLKFRNSWLTHSPMHPNELRDHINIHGHVHKQSIDDPRYINVSCEVIAYKPVDLIQLSTK